jgi:hypothetical protein
MKSLDIPDPANSDQTATSRARSKHRPSRASVFHKSVPHKYVAFGLRIGCSMPLPDINLAPSGSSSAVFGSESNQPGKALLGSDICVADNDALDVVIQRANLPPIPKILAGRSGLAIHSTADTAHLIWPECGQFLVRSGRTIEYRPASGRTEEDLHAPLLGVVLGIVLAQRGIFTLHASAVTIRGEAVGFIGEKGAGKSTTAAALLAQGHSLLTDDVLAIETMGANTPTVHPAFPRMKLWPDVIAANGHQVASLPCVTRDSEKRVQAAHRFACSSAPLTRIYLLESGPRVHASRVSEQAAFRGILPHVYAARFLAKSAGEVVHFEALRQIVKSVPVYRLERPLALSRLDDLSHFIDAAQR